MSKVTNTKAPAATACKEHPAYEADNCPVCGTAQKIGANGPTTTKAPAKRRVAAAKATTKKAEAKAPAPATVKPQNIGGPVTSVEHPAASPSRTSKAPAKAASKATAKAPAKATKATTKAPAKRASSKAPAHPGGAWLMVLDTKGLSQSEAARQMGVAPMTLNRLLNGHGIPTAKVTVAFARVTEQKVEDVWQQVADYELALALAEGGKA